ncbi:hypothetical protein EDC04DRAFT_2646729, partial [Pisolithus marmoratus]
MAGGRFLRSSSILLFCVFVAARISTSCLKSVLSISSSRRSSVRASSSLSMITVLATGVSAVGYRAALNPT